MWTRLASVALCLAGGTVYAQSADESVSRRLVLPTRPAPNCQMIRHSALVALSRRGQLNLNVSSAFCPQCLRRLKALPKRLDQCRRLIPGHPKRLQNTPLPKRQTEPIRRQFRSAALLPTRPQGNQTLQPSRRASLPRQLRQPQERSGRTLPGKRTPSPKRIGL